MLFELNDDFFTISDNLSIIDAFEEVQENVENSKFFISRKYKGNADTTADTDIKVEGVIKVNDPVNFNDSVAD